MVTSLVSSIFDVSSLYSKFTHSFIHSFVRSLVRSFVRSFVHSFIQKALFYINVSSILYVVSSTPLNDASTTSLSYSVYIKSRVYRKLCWLLYFLVIMAGFQR